MEYDGRHDLLAGLSATRDLPQLVGRGAPSPRARPTAGGTKPGTSITTSGFSGSLPFDFTDPPVELSSRNPWIRVTPSGAYSNGERVFEGVASLMVGVANLKAHLRVFYGQHQSRPATTADMEALLVCRSGEPRIVDAFHRFVYGFPDPLPGSRPLDQGRPGGSRRQPVVREVLGLTRPVDPECRRRRHRSSTRRARPGQLVLRASPQSQHDCNGKALPRHVQRQGLRRHRIRLSG